jgi:LCP family protein required for cell wall assembly
MIIKPMTKKLALFIFIILITAMACSYPLSAGPANAVNEKANPRPQAVANVVITAPANATATATPFLPVGPTYTPGPTQATDVAVTPVATEEPITIPTLPTPIRVEKELPQGTVNFVVLGNDLRPGGGFRTDVIMLVSVNGTKGTVSVVSFPRDLYVTIPGWTTQRINTAFQAGGFQTLASTLEYNFGVRPSFYVMTNFQGFIDIINGLGGIEVQAGSFLSDSCDLPIGRAGRCTIYPGSVMMDGETALWYVRSRHSSSDFDRMRRAQEVLYGIFKRLMGADALLHLPDFFNAYQSSVQTNITLADIVPLAPLATTILQDSSRVRRYSVGAGYVYNYITEEGAMVLLPNYAAITQLLAEAVFNQ